MIYVQTHTYCAGAEFYKGTGVKWCDMDLTLIYNSGHKEDRYVIKTQQLIIQSFEIS